MSDAALLQCIDAYLDEVPRAAARAETVGSFTLFVRQEGAWPYYARPTPGAPAVAAGDIEAVRARQRALGVPETFEWIVDVTPSVSTAASAAGLAVRGHPLLFLAVLIPSPLPDGYEVRFATPDDDLAWLHSVAEVGFAHPGTAVGEAGHAAAATEAGKGVDVGVDAFMRRRLAQGSTVSAGLYDSEGSPVAFGSHQPVNGATELVGVATLPAFRRKGLAAVLISALVLDALTRECDTIFLSADDEAVARVYERVGFRRIGTAGAAEPASR